MQKSLISFLILIAILIQPGRAQELNPSLGWDLTYTSVLEKNNVARSEFIWKWLNFSYQGPDSGWQTPAKKWIAEWQGEPIVSSVLIDYPAFHAAEHDTHWLVRTKNNAYYWQIIDDGTPKVFKLDLPLQAYDDLFREASSWQQAVPSKAEDLPPQALPGYIGFLSLYEKGKSRQMLLTLEDFMGCVSKECKTKEVGRVLRLLVDIPEDPRCSEKNYKPKSKTELAAMTPRELVEELVKSTPALYDSKEMPDYIRTIELKIRKAGIEVLPVLTEYMNEVEPERGSRCEESRFSTAQIIAQDIDRFEFRVRGTKEGQQAIEALERAIKRMEKVEEHNGSQTLVLDKLKGTNEVDEAIKDTFWVRKKIKLSEGELLEFSNFLIARDPTYPSWSDTDYIKDYSRINEWGNPLQVYILKKPKRFYEAYSEFKKARLKNVP